MVKRRGKRNLVACALVCCPAIFRLADLTPAAGQARKPLTFQMVLAVFALLARSRIFSRARFDTVPDRATIRG
jgi:hypothetical protein